MDLQVLNLLVSGATLGLLTYITISITGRLRTMSTAAQDAQQALDNLVAGALQLFPQVGKTLNDLVTINGQLLQQIADSNQIPQTTMDPAKVMADVAAIQAQMSALGVAEQNATPSDTIANPPPPPADGGGTPPASTGTPST